MNIFDPRKLSSFKEGTNLHLKLTALPNFSSCNYFCCWSDLLGFGTIFKTKNWELTIEDKRAVYERLQLAHSIFTSHISIQEKALFLNDAFCKIFKMNEGNFEKNSIIATPILTLSLFFRSCVFGHIQINKNESSLNLPGTRTILTFGEGINYFTPEIKLDDLIFNYTKENPNELSNIAKKTGNPTLIYIPHEFQMNIAFSKAYILDEMGSKKGIKGNHFFIDNSILSFLKKYCIKNAYIYTESENEFCILRNKNDINDVILGFKFAEKIKIEEDILKTTVFKVESFYCHDEPKNIFKLDLY